MYPIVSNDMFIMLWEGHLHTAHLENIINYPSLSKVFFEEKNVPVTVFYLWNGLCNNKMNIKRSDIWHHLIKSVDCLENANSYWNWNENIDHIHQSTLKQYLGLIVNSKICAKTLLTFCLFFTSS